MTSVRYLHSSDRALTVEFGNEISEKIHHQIRAFCLLLQQSDIPGITEVVPTYRSVMVHYEPHVILYSELIARLEELVAGSYDMHLPESKIVEVPVYYGDKSGPDLARVARHNGLTEKQVIDIHTRPHYLIYMLGFTPGFAYMGGMDERIATPRLESPRVKLPAGSVGIAGSQTGIYPIESPGGWQIIGQTPLVLYDHKREDPILFEAGQRIRFVPITREEYIKIKGEPPTDFSESEINMDKEAAK
ncbi:MAG: 5-oxoprolinase subunit PxpB [Christensenellaceae bacterium]|nr:5-oxoprolinase subunit PxpB [Christensenellaceae bacterium]